MLNCRSRKPTVISNPVILIPARLRVTRLPAKPLLIIAGLPMIVHVWRRAIEAADALAHGADIGTLAAEISEPSEVIDPNVVKAIGSLRPDGLLNALYFTRAAAPFGSGPFYHHIGIYAYKREALARFVAMPPSDLEKRERLEQLRALEAGMRIHISVVDTIPLGVDTEADLEKAREMLAR
jgi:3-deoxy-manno-octulosonate cytidylyltransferase (CMP-KDO synthetase)